VDQESLLASVVIKRIEELLTSHIPREEVGNRKAPKEEG
jgi:hypothetical protein